MAILIDPQMVQQYPDEQAQRVAALRDRPVVPDTCKKPTNGQKNRAFLIEGMPDRF